MRSDSSGRSEDERLSNRLTGYERVCSFAIGDEDHREPREFVGMIEQSLVFKLISLVEDDDTRRAVVVSGGT